MPNAIVMTGYGPPEVLKWAGVPLPEPGKGQIRIKVRPPASARPIWPCALAISKPSHCPLMPCSASRQQAPSTRWGPCHRHVHRRRRHGPAAQPGRLRRVHGSVDLGRKPDAVSWIDAAALPSSAEAAERVLRQLNVTSGETLLLFGGGGSVGIIATQLAVARGVKVISAVGEHDETLARELGATPVRYGAGLAGRVRALGRWTPCLTQPAPVS